MLAMLDINAEGKLDTLGTVRGRKTALKQLVEKMQNTADMERWNHVFLAHGDCEEEAERVKLMIENAFPNAQVHVSQVGAVIGAHTGSDVMVLCYLGKTIKGSKQ